jgi:hypothetical protein
MSEVSESQIYLEVTWTVKVKMKMKSLDVKMDDMNEIRQVVELSDQ